MAPDRVNFIDENDAGSVLLALFKQVADAAGAHANKHFDKIGAGNREEGNVRFPRDGTCQQGFAGSGRPHQQDAFGNTSPQFLEFLGLAQELDDLPQFFFGLFYTRHIFECDFLPLHREQPHQALAEGQGLVAAGLHLPDHEEPPRTQQDQRSPGAEQLQRQAAAIDVAEGDRHTLALQVLQHLGSEVIARSSGVKWGTIFELAADFHPVDRDLADVVLIDITHELSDVYLFILLAVASALYHLPQQERRNPDQQPEQYGLYS